MASLPQPGDLVADKYRVVRLIGQGGMGAVFEARHEVMDKPVALKWLHPELSRHDEAEQRFLQEARAAARIRHPNVVDVYDVGRHGGGLFMVMELLRGQPFDTLIARGDLPVPDALSLLLPAMRGVAAAHREGIIHRDIKPENIFVSAEPESPAGVAKVLDFGISKLRHPTDHESGVTETGVTMGTPAYMPMEQIHSARDVDARSDIYSFGVLLYRVVTGRLPFTGDSIGAIAVQVATHTPPTPQELRPELPAALDAIIQKAMARERDDRYGSMSELAEALSGFCSGQGYRRMQMAAPVTVQPGSGLSNSVPQRDQAATRKADTAVSAERQSSGPAITTPAQARGRARRWRTLAAVVVALLVSLAGAVLTWWAREASPPAHSPAPSVAASVEPPQPVEPPPSAPIAPRVEQAPARDAAVSLKGASSTAVRRKNTHRRRRRRQDTPALVRRSPANPPAAPPPAPSPPPAPEPKPPVGKLEPPQVPAAPAPPPEPAAPNSKVHRSGVMGAEY